MRKIIFLMCVLWLLCPVLAQGAEPQANPPQTIAQAVILVEQSTGKTLYAKSEDKRMYPASMTKIVTALVALDHFQPEEFIVMGAELREVPEGSSLAYHEVGETILVENLLRGLLIPSGNESGCALALAVAKRVREAEEMNYADAEKIFCDLMNEKAAALGAKDTHFTNPHGFHDDNHYTTAYDMALFSREFMEDPLLAEIVSEQGFDGNGAGLHPPSGAQTKVYSQNIWKSRNKLILETDPNYYTYANGIKTGTTGEAGDCLAASAVKDDVMLICVVMQSTEPDRWTDAKNLLEYGFANYAFTRLLRTNEPILSAHVENPQLGAAETLSLLVKDEFVDYISRREQNEMQRNFSFNDKYLAPGGDAPGGDAVYARAPIQKGVVVGKVTYILSGETVFTTDLLAGADVEQRTFQTDASYYFQKFKARVFTMSALPYWVCGFAAVLAIVAFIAYRSLSGGRRRKSSYRMGRKL